MANEFVSPWDYARMSDSERQAFLQRGGRVVNDSVFDPGMDEREKAMLLTGDLTSQYEQGFPEYMPNQGTDRLTFSDPNTGIVTQPTAIKGYEPGAPLSVTDEMRIQNMIGRNESAWNGMAPGATDPLGRQGQIMTGAYFGNIAAGGKDAVADAEYERRRQQAEQLARGQREAALQSAEMRGGGRGGAELLADITGGQQAATSANMAGMQAAADMQRRRDAAAQASGNMATALRSGDFSERARNFDEQSRIADAQDQWNQWWGEAQRDVDAYNADREAKAGVLNWERQNQTADANTGLFNQAGLYNQQGDQRAFDNWLRYLAGKGGAVSGQTSALQFDALQDKGPLEPVGDILEFGGNVAGGYKKAKEAWG